jgi:ribonuclease T2
MMGTINACFIMLVLSSIGAIAKTKVFNDSVGLEDAYYRRMDFYYFVQRWPATYCHWTGTRSDYCCSPQKGNGVSKFSIHGLWPTYYQGYWPQNCCSVNKNSRYCLDRQFNPQKILHLEDNLNWYWASIRYTGSSRCSTKINVEFWRHEWEKHGTCSRLYLEQYFQNTISLRDSIDLHGALKTAGIHPNGSDYSLTDITNAIRHRTGKHPRITCNENLVGKSQLFEVYLCVELDAYTLMDCPSSQIYPISNCDPNRVVFPRFGKK